MQNYVLKDNNISFNDIYSIVKQDLKLTLDKSVIDKINNSRKFLEDKITNTDNQYYGINTGFGDLHNVKINSDDLSILQSNLIKSHACGTGNRVGNEIVRLMILLKIISLSKGYSGIRLETVERLVFFYNNNILPIVYKYGSLGASGDLSPLSHLSLPLIGLGEVEFKNDIYKTETILKKFKIEKIKLESKEGLALINGTQYMLASVIFSVIDSLRLSFFADKISSVSLDAFNCDLSPFNHLVSKIRPHEGQLNVSKIILTYLKGSQVNDLEKEGVQDPYSFRCIPQVHGATRDTISYCIKIITTEINSVTDNPLIFSKEDKIISGGNFHGQPLAFAIDFLKIAISELGSISERRVFNLMSGKRNLPSFLSDNPGLNSGLMILQYTSASLVSSNKQYANPSSTDSITSSNGQEDHVSMGANGANQLRDIIDSLYDILAIELITASQAKEYNSYKSSNIINEFIDDFRKLVSKITNDRVLSDDIKKTANYLRDYKIEKLLF